MNKKINLILLYLLLVSFIATGEEIKYYIRNFVKREGLFYYRNDKGNEILCNGEYTIHNWNNSIIEKISLKEGKIHGLYKRYNSYGVWANLNYSEGELHGLAEYYNRDGSISIRGNYKEGKLHGIYELYFSNGDIRKKEEYVDGEAIYREIYRGNGARFSIYKLKNNIKDGEVKYYYDDDSLLGGGEYKDGVPVGEWKGYHKNGNLRKISQYVDGKLNGEFKIYYPSGKIQVSGTFKDGFISGNLTYFYENGNKKSVTHYVIPFGGNHFSSSKKTGLSEHLDEAGNLIALLQYDHEGNMTGTQSYINGKLAVTKNVLADTYKIYYENGQILAEKLIEDRNDIYTVYFENGDKLGTFENFYQHLRSFSDGQVPSEYFE